MIQKTVYFRTQEDLDKFNILPNKAEWLHLALNLKLRTPTNKEKLEVEADPLAKTSPPLSETVVSELDNSGSVVGVTRDDVFNPSLYIYDPASQAIYEKESGERVELTADQVKQIKGTG